MVLLADAHRHPDQAEAGVALINHAAAVVVVLPIDLPVDNGTGNTAVPSCRRETRRITESSRLPLLKSSHTDLTVWLDLSLSLCSNK